jgi:hypothetical protein
MWISYLHFHNYDVLFILDIPSIQKRRNSFKERIKNMHIKTLLAAAVALLLTSSAALSHGRGGVVIVNTVQPGYVIVQGPVPTGAPDYIVDGVFYTTYTDGVGRPDPNRVLFFVGDVAYEYVVINGIRGENHLVEGMGYHHGRLNSDHSRSGSKDSDKDANSRTKDQSKSQGRHSTSSSVDSHTTKERTESRDQPKMAQANVRQSPVAPQQNPVPQQVQRVGQVQQGQGQQQATDSRKKPH